MVTISTNGNESFTLIKFETMKKKKYTVLKFMTRRAEGMKPYEVGSVIELVESDAKPLLEHGFIKVKFTRKKEKDEGKSK